MQLHKYVLLYICDALWWETFLTSPFVEKVSKLTGNVSAYVLFIIIMTRFFIDYYFRNFENHYDICTFYRSHPLDSIPLTV